MVRHLTIGAIWPPRHRKDTKMKPFKIGLIGALLAAVATPAAADGRGANDPLSRLFQQVFRTETTTRPGRGGETRFDARSWRHVDRGDDGRRDGSNSSSNSNSSSDSSRNSCSNSSLNSSSDTNDDD
jgi:hypothetical protein